MSSTKKKSVKLKIKKLKFAKEFTVRYDIQSGGCSEAGGCSHWV